MRFDSFELCYRVGTNAALTGVATPTSADVTPSVSRPIVDGTVRPAGEGMCRTYSAAGPGPIGPGDTFRISISSRQAAGSSIQVSRLTVNLSD